MVTDSAHPGQPPAFADRLRHRAGVTRGWLCVGLDPDPASFPPHLRRDPAGVVEFCRAIVDATQEFAAAFKVNFGFFEALGPEGWTALDRVRRLIPNAIPAVADAKRGDIPSTARFYARAILDVLGFDAVTVNPYPGWDSVLPYLEYAGTAAFILCQTSNPGAIDLQDLSVEGSPLYMHVARSALALEQARSIGLVVGATQPGAMRAVRALSEDAILLVPGVGAQGASARDAALAAGNSRGENALIAASRSILYASAARDFAEAASRAARELAAQTWVGRPDADGTR